MRVDPFGRLVRASAAVRDFLLKTGVSESSFFPMELHETVLQSMEKQSVLEHEYRVGNSTFLLTISPSAHREGAYILVQDISQLAEAKMSLQSMRDRLETIYETAWEGMVVMDATGRIESVNDAACILTGYEKAELVGHPVGTLIPELHEAMARDQEANDRLDLEAAAIRRDGTPVSLEMRVERIPATFGTPSAIAVFLEKMYSRAGETSPLISAFQKAAYEVALACQQRIASREDLREALRKLGESSDADRVYLCESRIEPFAGIPYAERGEQWLADPKQGERPSPFPEELWYGELPDLYERLKSGQPALADCREATDNQKAFLEESGTKTCLWVPAFVTGEFWGFVGLDHCRRHYDWGKTDRTALALAAGNIATSIVRGRDLEKLDHARTALAQFEAECSECSWNWDILTDKLEFSENWLRLLSYTEENAPARFQAWQDILHPSDRLSVLSELDRHLNGEAQDFRAEYRIRTGTGEWKWVRDRGVAATGKAGAPERLRMFLTDIDAQKLSEEMDRIHTVLLDAILRVQKVLLSEETAENTAEDFLENLARCTGSELAFLGTFTSYGTESPFLQDGWMFQQDRGPEKPRAKREKYRSLLGKCNFGAIWGEVENAAAPAVIAKTASEWKAAGWPEEFPPLQSFLGIPFQSEESVQGLIGLANRPGGYSRLMPEAAAPCGPAWVGIWRAREMDRRRKLAEDKLLQQSEVLQILENKVSKMSEEGPTPPPAINRLVSRDTAETVRCFRRLLDLVWDKSQTPEQFFTACLEAGCELLSMPSGIISRVENDRYFVQGLKSRSTFLSVGLSLPLKNTFCAEVVRTGKIVAYAWASRMHALQGHPAIGKLGMESYIGAPVVVYGNLMGTLAFSSSIPRGAPFTDLDQEMVEFLAQKVGHFIESHVSETRYRSADTLVKKTQTQCRNMAAALNRSDSVVVITNARGQVEWVNQAFTRLTDYTLEEITGRKPGRLLQGPETDPSTVQTMRDRIGRAEEFSVEILNYSKNRKKYWIKLTIQPSLDENGKLAQYIAVGKEIPGPSRPAPARPADEQVILLDEEAELTE